MTYPSINNNMVDDERTISIGTYIRVRFDAYAKCFLHKLADQIATNAESCFFSVKQNPENHFHIKLLTSYDLTNKSVQTVLNALNDTRSIFPIHGQVVPSCIVDSKGQVSLKINSNDCVQISEHLSKFLLLPGAFDSHPSEDNLLVKIGNFKGPHILAFETWLNLEFNKNSSSFPSFIGSAMELSDEWGNSITLNPFLPESEQEDVLLEENEFVGSIINATDDNTEIVEPTAALTSTVTTEIKPKKEIKTMGQRLITAATTIVNKLGGQGVVIKMEENSVVDIATIVAENDSVEPKQRNYAIVPSDLNEWQTQCSKLFTLLDGMLRDLGVKVLFIKYDHFFRGRFYFDNPIYMYSSIPVFF